MKHIYCKPRVEVVTVSLSGSVLEEPQAYVNWSKTMSVDQSDAKSFKGSWEDDDAEDVGSALTGSNGHSKLWDD